MLCQQEIRHEKMSYKNIYLQVPQPVLIEHAPNFNSFWNKLFFSKNCSKSKRDCERTSTI
jgi:hypothetical protein